MADVTITAASVLASAQARKHKGTAGATITQGQALYYDSSTNTLKLADADSSATTANCVGIALTAGASGQDVIYTDFDPDFTPGGTLSLSAAADTAVYVLSGTAGAIAPMDDMAAGDYPVIIGVATSASKMKLSIIVGTAVLTA